ILQRETQRASEGRRTGSSLDNETVVPAKIEKLPILDEPSRDRAVFTWAGHENLVYFEGEGNVDFQCGSCGSILARRIWKLSCNNIIVKCPMCGSYNEFPPQE